MADENNTMIDNTETKRCAKTPATTIKKEVKNFSFEETEKLISLWGGEEVLYNCRNEEYFNKDARAAALNRILAALEKEGLTLAEIQKKMGCLRTYYGKEFGKEKASKISGTGAKNVYASKWPFFTTLHFLRDNITPRKTSSSMETTVVIVNDNNDQEEEKVESNEDAENTTPVFSCVFNTNNPPSSKSKRKLQMSMEDELLTSCLKELKRPKTETSSDADTTFGQYVTKQLHKIPDGYAKEMLKLELQQSILKVMLPTPARQPFSTISFSDFE